MATPLAISSDSHVVEPPGLWVDRIEPAFRDRAPRVVRRDGADYWQCQGATLASVGMMLSAGVEPSRIRPHIRYEEGHAGGWDPHRRIQDMAADGVVADVLYPSIALRIFEMQDIPLLNACLAAYNTWIAEFCQAYPRHMKGIAVVSLDDVARAAAELQRTRKLGLAGVMICVDPGSETSYGDPSYDQFWATAQELEMPVTLHVGSQRKASRTIGDAIIGHLYIQKALADLVCSGIFQRLPRLKVISAEADVTWAAHLIEKLDKSFTFLRTRFPIATDRPPSQIFRDHVWLTFIRDLALVHVRHLVGVDRIMWSSDYPHHDSTWPRSQEVIAQHFDGIPESERRRMVWENVAELYGFERGLQPVAAQAVS